MRAASLILAAVTEGPRRRPRLVHRAANWRTAVHQRPTAVRIYRGGVAVVGGSVVALGVVLIPLPGPGWLIVFLGLSILASEFAWAERLLRYARARVSAWMGWVEARSLVTRLVIGGSGVAVLLGLVAALAVWQGVIPLERTAAQVDL